MNQPVGFFRKLEGISGSVILASAVIGVLLAYFAVGLLQTYAEDTERAELEIRLGKLQEALSIAAARNRAAGVATLMGLNEPLIKRAALGKTGLDAPDLLQRLRIARKQFGFEGLYIADRRGSIVANDTDGQKSTGTSVAFRPYFQSAIKGQEAFYLAIGTNSDTRGMFVAAPVHETTEPDSAIIGIVAIKLSVETALDEVLRNAGSEALLISPQGIVFASTRKQWLLTVTTALDDRRLQAIRDLQQFGVRFQKTRPELLGFDPTTPAIELEGRRFIAEHMAMNWNDPNGPWTAVLMEDADKRFTQPLKLGIAGGIFLAAVLAGIFLQLQMNRTRDLNATLARENEARIRVQQSNLAAAEERALMARVSSELRQARSLPELVKTFMHHASELFDIRMGIFYVADGASRKLRLIGGYGISIDEADTEVAYGEGMAGQCAVEEKKLRISEPPADYIRIESGGGGAAPRNIYLHPLILKDKLVGVLELASFGGLTDKQEKMLSEFETIAAANIELIEQRTNLDRELRRQQESEESLRHQTLLQQALIDTIPYPIFYKDADSRFLGFNKAYERTFDVDGSQLIGKKVLDLDYLPAADRVAFQAEDEQVIAEIGQVRREVSIPFADGALHKTLYFVSGFRLADGRPGGLVGIFIDLELAQKDIEHG